MIQIPVSETIPAQMKTGILLFLSTPCLPRSQMYVVRNALTGFRSGWQRAKTVPSNLADTAGERAQVDRFDYAADDSEDDGKEATSMSIRKPKKENESSSVRSTQ